MKDESTSEEKSDGASNGPGGRSLPRRVLRAVTPGVVRRRYAVRFTISIALVVVVVAAVGAVTYVDAREMARDDSEAQVASTVELQADSLSRWIDGIRTQTRTVSARESLAEGDRSAMRERLKTARNRSSNGVTALYLVDAEDDEVVASTKQTVEGWSLDRVEMPWADPGVADSFEGDDDVWTSRAYVSKTTTYTDEDSPWYTEDDKYMAVASPVAGSESVYLVVAGGIDDRVANLHQPATNQTTWIVTTEGETVLESDATNVSSAGLVGSRVPDRQVTLRERGDFVVGFAPIEGTDWVAVTTIRKSEAYALGSAVGRNIGYLVGASLLALLGVGVVLGRRTVRPLADLRERSERMGRGELDVDLRTHREDEFGRLYDAFADMRDELRDQIRTTERLNSHLERKADDYSAVMDECAEGDLTRRMDPDSDSEAMTAIADSFNAMMADIEETTADLKTFADEVYAASEVVTASSEEVYSASEQVTESVQEISDGAEVQNQRLQAVADEMSGLSATTEEIAASSNEVADLAEETAETGREGRKAAQEAIEGLDKIEATSDEAVAEIERLEDEVAEVDELIEFIGEIATQTNMLALNASIEVSRSSTDGGNPEGFSAVANKIKELAEEAKVASEDIEQRLERIKEQTERTGDEVQSASDQISRHTDSIAEAVDALEEIADYAQETNTGVQNISEATEEQADSTEEVVTMFDEVARISDETTAEAENVAAAAEEQTTALTEVSRSASDLTAQADLLSEALARFETDADAGGRFADDSTPERLDEQLSLPVNADDPGDLLDAGTDDQWRAEGEGETTVDEAEAGEVETGEAETDEVDADEESPASPK
ncbi:methyl-accepting chemotaxis protein [Halorussus lipolyticus]|uniref:methyl-accepting chemotaxis protein n=1 Tax=Halorussus lipolyticus TaxID=3034024 RepID=UPI0023E8206D|nr:methyl-accepting chemotaxis protein [Halorussus sp. DT80]